MTLPRTKLLIGGILSLAVGLVLGALTFVIVLNTGGNPMENSSYCSKYGIGDFEPVPIAAGKEVVYVNGKWSGFPPAQRCRVYALEPTASGQTGSAEELLAAAPLPHLVIAEGSYPTWAEWVWVLVAVLSPPAIWGLFALSSRRRRRS